MKNTFSLIAILFLVSFKSYGQYVVDSLGQNLLQINGYQRILQNLDAVPNGMTFGGYGEILYNQPDTGNGEIDVQRLIEMPLCLEACGC